MARGPGIRCYNVMVDMRDAEMAIPRHATLRESRDFVRALLTVFPEAKAKIISIPRDGTDPIEVQPNPTWTRNDSKPE